MFELTLIEIYIKIKKDVIDITYEHSAYGIALWGHTGSSFEFNINVGILIFGTSYYKLWKWNCMA